MTNEEILRRLRARLAEPSSRIDSRSLPSPNLYPPATLIALKHAETALGVRFPLLLARIYTEIANGGFAPAAGLLGLAEGYPDLDGRTAIVRYEWLRGQRWREQLLPAFDWGDGSWSCVDISTPNGLIVTVDGDGFTATRFDVECWFNEWLSGTSLHDEIFEIGEATIVNPFTQKPMIVRRRIRPKGKLIEGF